MFTYALLALIPIALGCTNPNNDPCASYMSANGATASAFCATFTQSTVTATTSLPSWASYCSSKPSQISKECSCYFTGGGAAATSTTTTAKTTSTTSGSGATPTGVTTSLPASSGATSTSAAITVSGSYDGGMMYYDRYRMWLLSRRSQVFLPAGY